MSTELVPTQEKGKSVDLQEEEIVANDEAAKKLFRDAVYLLSRPGTWHEAAGALSAKFIIDGKEQEDIVQAGDHIRIDIPGPGLSEGEGYDWVRVADIEENFDHQFDESFGISLLVCPNPHTRGDAVAHFFADGASSSFLLLRKDMTVTARYKGRNETPNKEDLALTDKIRNMLVAGGALAGVSELQWTALLKGLLSVK